MFLSVSLEMLDDGLDRFGKRDGSSATAEHGKIELGGDISERW